MAEPGKNGARTTPAKTSRFVLPRRTGNLVHRLRHPRWNLSSQAADFRLADGFVVSIPKSGRTWVRCFFSTYFAICSQQLGEAFTVPNLRYTHDAWENAAKRRLGERLRGKWLIPRRQLARKPVVLVARDPRDTLVSLFFQLRERKGTFHGDLSGLVRHPLFGARRMVTVMNRWMREWGDSQRVHLLRYEEARRDPHGAFTAALRSLQPGLELELGAFDAALDISSFDNMRALECGDAASRGAEYVAALNRTRKNLLRPANRAVPDSFKVRRGRVGGYTDYLSPSDITFVENEIARLDPRYGYRPRGARAE